MARNIMMGEGLSPCIGRCSLKAGDEMCKGCGRSMDEIKAWRHLPEEERKIVNTIASKRLEQKQ